MLIYKTWKERQRGITVYVWAGYFLFGFIPLYLIRYPVR